MQSFNRVYILGHLSRDPETRTTPRGSFVCEFSVAVSSRKVEEGEAVDAADFLPVAAWDRLGTLCYERLRKGSLVHVEGHLKTRRWVDRKTRKNHARLVVTASQVNFLSRLHVEE